MKKLALSLALLSTTAIMALESAASETTPAPVTLPVDNSYGYFTLGLGPFPLPIPVFGLGYRFQRSHHGMNISANATTIVSITQVKGNLIYNYYPNPNLKSQGYFGFGVSPSYLFVSHHHKDSRLYISPEFVLGKEYINDSGDRRFFEAQISWPTVSLTGKVKPYWFPLVVFNYGFCF